MADYNTPRYSVDRTSSYNGSRHWKARLNEEDVRLINQLLAEGLSQAEIAKKFEVGRHIIHNIARGRSWRHVT